MFYIPVRSAPEEKLRPVLDVSARRSPACWQRPGWAKTPSEHPEANGDVSEARLIVQLVVDTKVLAADELVAAAGAVVEAAGMLVPEAVSAPANERAMTRVPRDPDDWPTAALARVLDAGLWTADADCLGCGLSPWTTDTVLSDVLP